MSTNSFPWLETPSGAVTFSAVRISDLVANSSTESWISRWNLAHVVYLVNSKACIIIVPYCEDKERLPCLNMGVSYQSKIDACERKGDYCYTHAQPAHFRVNYRVTCDYSFNPFHIDSWNIKVLKTITLDNENRQMFTRIHTIFLCNFSKYASCDSPNTPFLLSRCNWLLHVHFYCCVVSMTFQFWLFNGDSFISIK
jgi:hypothetical protein